MASPRFSRISPKMPKMTCSTRNMILMGVIAVLIAIGVWYMYNMKKVEKFADKKNVGDNKQPADPLVGKWRITAVGPNIEKKKNDDKLVVSVTRDGDKWKGTTTFEDGSVGVFRITKNGSKYDVIRFVEGVADAADRRTWTFTSGEKGQLLTSGPVTLFNADGTPKPTKAAFTFRWRKL